MVMNHVKNRFANKTLEKLVIALIQVAFAVISSYYAFISSSPSALIPLFFLSLALFQFLCYISYRTMSKSKSANELVSDYDRYKEKVIRWNKYISLFFVFGICVFDYDIIVEALKTGFDHFTWISLFFTLLLIAPALLFFFNRKVRVFLFNASNSKEIEQVEQLRKLVDQEQEKSVADL